MNLAIIGKASKVFQLIGRMAREEKQQDQEKNQLTEFLVRQLYSYTPEWLEREVDFRGLAGHLASRLLTRYQIKEG